MRRQRFPTSRFPGFRYRQVCSLLLAAAVMLLSMGAADIAGRYNALNHQMMCTCGCVQLLGECNHVGCPNSPVMLANLHKDISSGMSDHAILVDFQEKYGPTALASPLLTRFNQTAWIMPPAVLILGLLGAWMLLRRWREGGRAAAVAAREHVPSAQETAALERIRRETRTGDE